MNEEITTINADKLSKIKAEIEAKREELKEHFDLTDQDYNLLIKELILDVYSRAGVRITLDDPIFTLLLTNKKVIDYNFIALDKSLQKIPTLLNEALTDQMSDFKTATISLSESLTTFIQELDKNLEMSNLKARNDLEKKLLESSSIIMEKTRKEQEKLLDKSGLSKFSKILIFLLSFFLIVNCVGMGFIVYKYNQQANIEVKYNVGLLNGYKAIESDLGANKAKKVQITINNAIEKSINAR